MTFVRMLAIVSFALSLHMSEGALACDCSGSLLNLKHARAAENVFLFKLMSATVQGEAEEEGAVAGRVKVLKTYKGNGTQFEKIRTHIRQCCGTRLNVGFTYVAFTSDHGSEFFGNSGSVLDIGISTYGISGEAIDDLVLKILNGSAEGEASYWGSSWRALQIVPVPHPPCLRGDKDDT